MNHYKFTINTDYERISDFIKDIPSNFDSQGEDIYVGRNRIKKYLIDEKYLNVKRYKKPIFINRIIYSFFRKPKAYKAYFNALEVIRRGFDTPSPIAFIREIKNSLISYSYFVSSQIEGYSEVRDFYFSKVETTEEREFFQAFSKFSAQLHRANILHLDYSPGNILYSKQSDGTYSFIIVDINRMKFKEVDLEKGCQNFSRLFEYDSVYEYIAPFYAKERNLDIKLCGKYLVEEKNKFHRKKYRKKNLKKLLKF